METLLIFLAIIAIQMIAAYFKQKKGTVKQQQPEWGLPEEPEEDPEESEYPILEEEEVPEPPLKREGSAPPPVNFPFRAITDRKHVEASEPKPVFKEDLPQVHSLKINTRNIEQGILWTAILQEPRYKVKWMPRCSR